MPSIAHWLSAARLRTLPLALSSILTGSALASFRHALRWDILGMAALTTILLQVLSNFANDYGDSHHGADNHERVGPSRTVQAGHISAVQMKRAMIFTALFAFLSGCTLLYLSGLRSDLKGFFFLVLGIAAIAAAIRYTAGKNPYGYKGHGDFFVFLFFGVVGVLGSSFLHDQHFPVALDILPAISIGALSAGVLNLNNMRDRVPDQKAGKITLAVRLGSTRARRYHLALLFSGMTAIVLFLFLQGFTWKILFPLLSIPLLLKHFIFVRSNTVDAALDSELKKLALATFFLSLLLFISSLI